MSKHASATSIFPAASLTGTVLRSVGECVYEWSMPDDRLSWSDGAASLLCIDDPDMMDRQRDFASLLAADTPQNRSDTILSSSETDNGAGVPYNLEYALCGSKLNTGVDIWVEDCGRWFAGADGRPERAHGVLRIISERRNADEERRRKSRVDLLTGLANRDHLNTKLASLFQVLARDGGEAGVLVVGLEHFDLINSVYGYQAGDEVIAEVARRLDENLRDVDIVGRFSGAKIAVLLPECDERNMLVAGYRILDMLSANVVETSSGPIAVSVCIGGVSIPRHANEPRQAFVAAQQALLESRRNRDASLVSFRPDTFRDAQRVQAAKMAKRIVTALNDGNISLAWQPIVDATTHETVFHEALLRLEDENGVVMAAGNFIAIAQELGLIRLVDHHALDLALATLQRCPDACFSLNVSNETACDPRWLAKLTAAAMADTTIGERLIVEITESHAAESMEEAARFIGAVKALGCKVALDDFGAGFTSFRNLKGLPFDIIKVDGQFVDDLANSRENQSFIRALVDLARLFDASVVVEWVEDDETAAMLRDWGVDLLQGYVYGEPVKRLPWAQREQETSAKLRSVA